MFKFILALWIAIIPIIFSISDFVGISESVLGVNFDIQLQLVLIAMIYMFYIIFNSLFKFDYKKFIEKYKNIYRKPSFILVAFILFSMIISSIINGVNSYSLSYFTIFIIFYIVYSLDKNQINKFLTVLLFSIAITCIMGFIDPTASFMPGFYGEGEIIAYPLSNQFFNPNYTAYVVSGCLILVILRLKDFKNWQDCVFNGLLFLIFGFYLFMNGSFSPITSIFVVLIVYLLYIWIKEKKLPLRLLIMFISLCLFAVVVDFIPNINMYRTCDYNYFLECISVFDNIFDTNILSHFINIETIPGSDGWNRSEFLLQSINALNPFIGNVKEFFFGYGSTYFTTLKPHLLYICLALDFGIITTIGYIAILIYYIIMLKKCKKDKDIINLALVFAVFIFNSFFGSLIMYWYYVFVAMLAVGFKLMKISDKN